MAKTYESYKDSGIAWIGEIPSEWKVGLVGRYFNEIKNPNINQEEKNTLQFKMGDIISKKRGDSKYNPETIEAYNVVEPGTIMINGLNLSFDFISQRVGQVHEKGAITSTYLALYPSNGMMSDYAKYLLKAYDNCKALHAMGRGLRATLSYGIFRSEPILIPSIDEQHSIASFLDTKCGEIDSLISLQEEMISELQAYKQSVITEAVTKGLDPNAKLVPSGIDWIGEIPDGWKLAKMNYICSIITDFVASGSFESLRVNVPYLDFPDYAMLVRTADLSGSAKSDKRVYISKHSYDFLRNSNLFGGEIILPNIGAVGDAYLVPSNLYDKMSLAPNAIMFKTRFFDKYYYYYFCGGPGSQSLKIMCQATAQPKFNKTQLRGLQVVLPPLEEQKRIAEFLDKKCSDINRLIEMKQQKIEKLKDYKKSVIYEYVTGKKRV